MLSSEPFSSSFWTYIYAVYWAGDSLSCFQTHVTLSPLPQEAQFKSSFFYDILPTKQKTFSSSSPKTKAKKSTSIFSNSLLPGVWVNSLCLCLAVNRWAKKYNRTSDMASRPSSLHLSNVYNVSDVVLCTEISKNKPWICHEEDHSLM